MLSAGEERRLAPLTAEIPKPLLPVLGRLLLERTCDALVTAGVHTLAINRHHHGEQSEGRIGASFRGVPVNYSYEPELLVTRQLPGVMPSDLASGLGGLVYTPLTLPPEAPQS